MFETNYSISENVVSRANQDGTIVLMKLDEGDTFFKINGVAAVVWKELSLKKNLNQIAEEIMNDYNVSADKLTTDMNKLLATLVEKDLIQKM
jgi:hypothetical protein